MATEAEIIEGNKLIAVFMEFPYDDPEQFIVPDYNGEFTGERAGTVEDLEYDNSWDWLMPVVEKIEKTYYQGFPIIANVSGSGAIIMVNQSNAAGDKFAGKQEIANTLNCNYFNDYPEAEQISKIHAVWLAVVAFIKWYNKQQPLTAAEADLLVQNQTS